MARRIKLVWYISIVNILGILLWITNNETIRAWQLDMMGKYFVTYDKVGREGYNKCFRYRFMALFGKKFSYILHDSGKRIIYNYPEFNSKETDCCKYCGKTYFLSKIEDRSLICKKCRPINIVNITTVQGETI